MTGQPKVGKTPTLQLIVGLGNRRDDSELTACLHTLSTVEKATSHLLVISEIYLPSVRQQVHDVSKRAKEAGGKIEQLRIDSDTLRSVAELSTLVGRESILLSDLYSIFDNLHQLQEYLTRFLISAFGV